MKQGGFLKVHKWWAAHYASMMAFSYLGITASHASPEAWVFIRTMLLFTLGSIGIASTGQLLNDLGDIQQDVRTGSPNILATRSVAERIVIFFIVGVIGVVPWFFLKISPLVIALLITEIILFLAYSLPPFRLKGRGILGPITDSLYGYVVTHSVTVLVFLSQFNSRLAPQLFLIFAFWWFVYGLAEILHHQLVDEPRDRSEGINTFAVNIGWNRALQFSNKVVLPLKVCAFTLLMVSLWPSSPLLPVIYLLYLWVSLRIWSRDAVFGFRDLASQNPIGYYCLTQDICITSFVRKWISLAAVVDLVLHEPNLYPVVLVHLLFFPKSVQVMQSGMRSITQQLNGLGKA